MQPNTSSTSHLPLPVFFEGGHHALCLESTLSDLPLYEFQVEPHFTGLEVAQRFEEYPQLPGVVLVQEEQFLGMISRLRLLEYLIRPQGIDLFLAHPLSVLHSYTRTRHLILADTTPILVAAQHALRRSPDQHSEPIVVQLNPQTYRLLNVHELNIAYWQIRGIETQVRYERTQAQMIQSEKMAGLGRLVDGVAHEILDPVGFIWGNLTHVSSYTDQLLELLAAYEAHFPDTPHPIVDLQNTIELDYLRQDLPRTIDSIRAGADRLKKLVTSLQNFCHIDEVYPKPADLHECLDSILLLLKSRLTGEIDVVKSYGSLPPVGCYIGQLSQVFINILTNAIDALIDQAIRQKVSQEFDSNATMPAVYKPQISITTQVRSRPTPLDEGDACESALLDSRWVSIRIANNGVSLSPEKRQAILDSFSIEKRAAKETSLAVSYQIVTAKHGGRFYVRSPLPTVDELQPAIGTEFEILLPLV